MDTGSFLSKGCCCGKCTLQIWRSPVALQMQFKMGQESLPPLRRRMVGPGDVSGSTSSEDSLELTPWDKEGKGADPIVECLTTRGTLDRTSLPPWMLLRSVWSLSSKGAHCSHGDLHLHGEGSRNG